jgi:hypothetical protein
MSDQALGGKGERICGPLSLPFHDRLVAAALAAGAPE